MMKVELPESKRRRISHQIKGMKISKAYSIREFASFIGSLGACYPAVKYGWVYMKDLEREKWLALKANNDNFEAQMVVSANVKEDLRWWKANIWEAYSPIKVSQFDLEIFSDASLSGWGACCNTNRAHGHWTAEDRKHHINYLELTAEFFGLKCFASEKRNCDLLLRIDNTTAISYINRMGGIQYEELSKIAKDIWKWCERRNIWIFASYIKSEENSIADFESRRLERETEYELNRNTLSQQDLSILWRGRPLCKSCE